MHTFTYRYLLIEDVCEHNKLDYDTVMMAISHSDISFGTNTDTLMTTSQLETILADAQIAIDGLDYNNHDEDDILISLGS